MLHLVTLRCITSLTHVVNYDLRNIGFSPVLRDPRGFKPAPADFHSRSRIPDPILYEKGCENF
jgi:hypothetical protein